MSAAPPGRGAVHHVVAGVLVRGPEVLLAHPGYAGLLDQLTGRPPRLGAG